MNKTDKVYRHGFDAGVKAKTDDIQSNYDSWRRACESRGISGQLFAIADLAVRQVIYANEQGRRPDEIAQEKKA